MKKLFVLTSLVFLFPLLFVLVGSTPVFADGEEAYTWLDKVGAQWEEDAESIAMGGGGIAAASKNSENPFTGFSGPLANIKRPTTLYTYKIFLDSNPEATSTGQSFRVAFPIDEKTGIIIGSNNGEVRTFTSGSNQISGNSRNFVIGADRKFGEITVGFLLSTMSSDYEIKGTTNIPSLGATPTRTKLISRDKGGARLYWQWQPTNSDTSIGVGYDRFANSTWLNPRVGPLPLFGTYADQPGSEQTFQSQRVFLGIRQDNVVPRRLDVAVGYTNLAFWNDSGTFKHNADWISAGVTTHWGDVDFSVGTNGKGLSYGVAIDFGPKKEGRITVSTSLNNLGNVYPNTGNTQSTTITGQYRF